MIFWASATSASTRCGILTQAKVAEKAEAALAAVIALMLVVQKQS